MTATTLSGTTLLKSCCFSGKYPIDLGWEKRAAGVGTHRWAKPGKEKSMGWFGTTAAITELSCARGPQSRASPVSHLPHHQPVSVLYIFYFLLVTITKLFSAPREAESIVLKGPVNDILSRLLPASLSSAPGKVLLVPGAAVPELYSLVITTQVCAELAHSFKEIFCLKDENMSDKFKMLQVLFTFQARQNSMKNVRNIQGFFPRVYTRAVRWACFEAGSTLRQSTINLNSCLFKYFPLPAGLFCSQLLWGRCAWCGAAEPGGGYSTASTKLPWFLCSPTH